MTKEIYIKITSPFQRDKDMAKALHKSNRVITGFVFVMYPLLLLALFLQKDPMLYRTIIVPLDGFIFVTVFRYLLNRPRPYETFGFEPVIKKDTKGKSFPSRHVFSAMIIAMTYVFCSPWQTVGYFLVGLAVILAAVRVFSGVHFISDVVAGLAAGILVAVIGYVIF